MRGFEMTRKGITKQSGRTDLSISKDFTWRLHFENCGKTHEDTTLPVHGTEEKINKAKADGIDVISLAIGDPVEATPDSIIDELCATSRDPLNHRYPIDEEKGMLAFRREVAKWYETRYGVTLNPETEILGLIGSKEGCHHLL